MLLGNSMTWKGVSIYLQWRLQVVASALREGLVVSYDSSYTVKPAIISI